MNKFFSNLFTNTISFLTMLVVASFIISLFLALIILLVGLGVIIKGTLLWLVYPYLIEIFPIQSLPKELTYLTALKAAFLLMILRINVSYSKEKIVNLNKSFKNFISKSF